MSSKRPLARLSVWLGQRLVGSLVELPNDSSLFTFDPGYARNPDRPVLSLSFARPDGTLRDEPLLKQMKLAPFFSNLLPEGELRRHASRSAGIKAVRDLPLLQLLGEDLPGAVVVRAEEQGPLTEDTQEETGPLTDAPENRPLRFSLAGVQMKLSANGSPSKGLTIPAEGRGGHWIVKLPSKAYPLVPENEHSMMRLASEVGIEVAESGLVPTEAIHRLPDGLRQAGNALWVKRFDRADGNRRIHMEDFNQVYAQMPDEKYDNYSYANMARDLAIIAGPDAVREFVRRVVFSAAIGNADMHLKNWTVIYPDGRTPRLSPAYDLLSTIAYIDDHTLALSVTSKEKDIRNFDEALLRRFASRVPVPEKVIVDAALETAEKIVQLWPYLKDDLPMDPKAIRLVSERIRSFPLTARL